MLDDERDHVFERVALGEDSRAVEAPIGQVGFQRLDQASFVLGLQVVLDGGRAGGKRVLPSWWIKQATSKQADIGEPNFGYGYQWWTESNGSYDAIGIFGQMIHIDPMHRLVIVTLSNWPKPTDDTLSAKRRALVTRITDAASR